MSDKKKTKPADQADSENKEVDQQVSELMDQIEQLQVELANAEQVKIRAQADYQNLRRRTEQEKQQVYQTASKIFISDLLEPLEQLNMAATQLNDSGLNMVLEQLGKTLGAHGLKPINALGKSFDIETMECIEVEDQVDAEEGVVTKQLRRGYKLGDEVIQHAQVIIGSADKN